MNTLFEYSGFPYSQLSKKVQWVVAIAIVLLAFVSQLLFGIEYFIIAGIAAILCTVFFRNEFVLLASYILVLIVVGLHEREEAMSVGPIEILTAFIMIAVLLYVVYKKLIYKRDLSFHPSLLLIIGYVFWAATSSILSIANEDNTFNYAFREFLSFSSLVVLPVLIRDVRKKYDSFDKYMFYLMIFGWLLILVVSVQHIRSTVAQATYLYETGFARYDVMNSSVLLLLFLGMLMLEVSWKKRIPFFIGMVIAVGGILISFARTSWVGIVFSIPLLILVSPRMQRKRGFRAILLMGGAGLLAFGIVYFSFPLIKAIVQFSFQHFTSSSKVGTDPSLVNRYIEWGYVFKQIFQTPITGVGFGGRFTLYNWLGGVVYRTGYTHNGMMVLLLKGGIVGLFLVMTAFISFFVLGIRVMISKVLTDKERMIARVGVISIVFMFFHMMTLGLFIHREVMWYLGLIWGYFIAFYEQIQSHKNVPNALAETAMLLPPHESSK